MVFNLKLKEYVYLLIYLFGIFRVGFKFVKEIYEVLF